MSGVCAARGTLSNENFREKFSLLFFSRKPFRDHLGFDLLRRCIRGPDELLALRHCEETALCHSCRSRCDHSSSSRVQETIIEEHTVRKVTMNGDNVSGVALSEYYVRLMLSHC